MTMELVALGGATFERALAHFRDGGEVSYRGMELLLRPTELLCRVPWPEAPAALTSRRALEALLRARFRLGALLASAPPLAATVGNREARLVLVEAGVVADDASPELFELRGDRLRRLRAAEDDA